MIATDCQAQAHRRCDGWAVLPGIPCSCACHKDRRTPARELLEASVAAELPLSLFVDRHARAGAIAAVCDLIDRMRAGESR